MEEIVVITNDKWVIDKEGTLDIDDAALIKAASDGGRLKVRIMSLKDVLIEMKDKEPENYKKLVEHLHIPKNDTVALVSLTPEQLSELARQGGKTLALFRTMAIDMQLDEARKIREWRIFDRMSWRAIARGAFEEGFLRSQVWQPASNQIMGMVLCERAAKMLGENYYEGPWN